METYSRTSQGPRGAAKENSCQKRKEPLFGDADELWTEARGRRSKENMNGLRLTGGGDELDDDATDTDEGNDDEADDDEADLR